MTSERNAAIVQLMAVPDENVDLDWLRQALQNALFLELATIPPYACGLWSIMSPEADSAVHRTIREIIFDEMSHLGLVGNMLSAIGGAPVLSDPARLPHYPGPLPGGVRPEVEVRLTGLTRSALDMYSEIEKPDQPLARGEDHTSIGAFYRRIRKAFEDLAPPLDTRRQIEQAMPRHGPGNDIVAMRDHGTVLTSIDVITEQGEGTHTSPSSPQWTPEGDLSHYYAFRELYHGRRLVNVDGRWVFAGDPVSLPRAHAVGEVPAGGWAADPVNNPTGRPVAMALDAFNAAYSSMLLSLEQAWRTEDGGRRAQHVRDAIRSMGEMRSWGRLVMQVPLPDGSGWHYCPEFRPPLPGLPGPRTA
ncbi:ferritin-like domain-containing protein [Streptoalloteichus tenebrarius]|uniref:ferritin-like domain-containing protein n=1 Tax=Streptoalloteichus tenebrarius (strain ATCC 17920 / DSM 40477 / JCM 4838 / CBS 697.72 / NBRC 16177 / NCIMB 11028 / NRRL B-12390 / A12253. 1 / ISP 5477) TaxID=1933 RepID=UPI0020A5D0D0|nr:ferritin-like protein [Streptoalloteichus tenebrarius]